MDIPETDRCVMPPSIWRALEHLGLHASAILRQARLPAMLHLNPKASLTTAQLFEIWKAIDKLAGNPDLGIELVDATNAVGHQTIYLAARYATDYRDGLHRIFRFKHLSSAERWHIEERDGEFAISRSWPFAAELEPHLLTQMSFGLPVDLGRKGTGHDLTPVRVEFRRPGLPRDRDRDYFGCPIRYDAPRNLLVLKSADLDLPFPGHNLELLEIISPALAAALREPQAFTSITDQVKAVLKRKLASGRPTVADVARDLAMSERSLQRRITEMGTTFRVILSDARQQLSKELLAAPGTDIDNIAYLVGYEDTTSFYRAFKGYEGLTPAQWRLQKDGRSSPISQATN